MAFGIRARGFVAPALAHIPDGERPSIDGPNSEPVAINAWLDTLHALAGKRSQQRLTWDAEARLRLAVRARRAE